MLEILSFHAYPWVVAGVFLLAMLPVLLLGLLRDVLDRQRLARDSAMWPARSRSFLLGGLAWVTVSLTLFAGVGAGQAATYLVLAFTVLVLALAPFAAWNPEVLSLHAPERWWRARWPGGKAVCFVLLLWLTATAISFSLGEIAERASAESLGMTLLMLRELVDWTWPLAALSLWLNAGSISQGLARLRAAVTQGLAGAYLWQVMLWCTAGILLAWPLLIIALMKIFVVPQYQEWQQATGLALPAGMRVLVSLVWSWEMLIIHALPLSIYLVMTTGRLGWVHGLGELVPSKRSACNAR